MTILSKKICWNLQIGASLFYPLLTPLIGTSAAAAFPFFLSIFFSLLLIIRTRSKIINNILMPLLLFPFLIFSSLLYSDVPYIIASIKTFGFIPSYLLIIFLIFRNKPLSLYLDSINFFFILCLLISSFSILELFSRFIPSIAEQINSYFQIIKATGLINLSRGEISGFLGGSSVLGFFGDIQTAAGLSVVTFCYFLFRRNHFLAFLSFLSVVCSTSTTAFVVALSILICYQFINPKLTSFLAVIIFFFSCLTALNLIFPDRLFNKIYGNSFGTIFEQFLSGLLHIPLTTLLLGIGYGPEGSTSFKESAFIEYIYMSGIYVILFHVALIYLVGNQLLSELSREIDKSNSLFFKSKFSVYIFIVVCCILNFGLTFHYNQLYNPSVSLAFVLFLTLPYFYFRASHQVDVALY